MIRKDLREPHHVEQIGASKTLAEFSSQLSTQRVDNLRPVLRPFLLQDVLPHAGSNLPVKQRQTSIHRLRHPLARLQDQPAHIDEKRFPREA